MKYIDTENYPPPNDPIWQQFNDPYRAYSNYAALVKAYSNDHAIQADTDYQKLARRQAKEEK